MVGPNEHLVEESLPICGDLDEGCRIYRFVGIGKELPFQCVVFLIDVGRVSQAGDEDQLLNLIVVELQELGEGSRLLEVKVETGVLKPQFLFEGPSESAFLDEDINCQLIEQLGEDHIGVHLYFQILFEQSFPSAETSLLKRGSGRLDAVGFIEYFYERIDDLGLIGFWGDGVEKVVVRVAPHFPKTVIEHRHSPSAHVDMLGWVVQTFFPLESPGVAESVLQGTYSAKQHHSVNISKYYQPIYMNFRVTALPLFADNYSYILQGTAPGLLVLVDPASPAPVMQYLSSFLPKERVSHVLYTHHHYDHAGGAKELIPALTEKFPQLQVLAGQSDSKNIFGVNRPLADECILEINKAKLKVLQAPCHTRGHVIYHFEHPSAEAVDLQESTIQARTVRQFKSPSCCFTGDTLFSGGVGKFFEGVAAQMTQILQRIAKAIPSETHLYCGHEYTLSNLRWSRQVDLKNEFLQQYWKKLEEQSLAGELCTIPTTLAREKEINLFYRAALGWAPQNNSKGSPEQVMGLLREMKNQGRTSL